MSSECLIGISDAFSAICLRVSVIFPTCSLYPQQKRAYSVLHPQAWTYIYRSMPEGSYQVQSPGFPKIVYCLPYMYNTSDRSLVTAFSFTLKALQKLRKLQSHLQQFQKHSFHVKCCKIVDTVPWQWQLCIARGCGWAWWVEASQHGHLALSDSLWSIHTSWEENINRTSCYVLLQSATVPVADDNLWHDESGDWRWSHCKLHLMSIAWMNATLCLVCDLSSHATPA